MERYTGVQCLPTEVSYTDKYLLAHVHTGVSGARVYRSLIWLKPHVGREGAVPVPAGNCKRSSRLHISANGEGGKAGRACYPRHLCELAKWKRNRLPEQVCRAHPIQSLMPAALQGLPVSSVHTLLSHFCRVRTL